MEISKVLEAIGEEHCLPQVALDWDNSLKNYPPTCVGFLTSLEIESNAAFAGFVQEDNSALLEAASIIGQNTGLSRLAWHCYRRVLDGPKAARLNGWPSFQQVLGERSGLFYLLVGLACVPRIRAWHRSMGIPESVTRDTCRQVWDFCENHRRGHAGRMGIYLNQLSWLRHYVYEPYFRLGRMEYWLKPFGGGVRVFRNRGNGDILALAEVGSRFDDAGYCIALDKNVESVIRFHEPKETYFGHPISPFGMAIPKEVQLPCAKWQSVFRKGDFVLEMHIPQGGALTPESRLESHRRALEFFPRYFSDRPFAGLTCNSWMFNNQLDEILPHSSNLIRFMRDVYLFPVPSTGQDGLWFIFLQQPIDLNSAPRETSLQRNILDFLVKGNKWRGGGMFILREDALKVGMQSYRNNWPICALQEL